MTTPTLQSVLREARAATPLLSWAETTNMPTALSVAEYRRDEERAWAVVDELIAKTFAGA